MVILLFINSWTKRLKIFLNFLTLLVIRPRGNWIWFPVSPSSSWTLVSFPLWDYLSLTSFCVFVVPGITLETLLEADFEKKKKAFLTFILLLGSCLRQIRSLDGCFCVFMRMNLPTISLSGGRRCWDSAFRVLTLSLWFVECWASESNGAVKS